MALSKTLQAENEMKRNTGKTKWSNYGTRANSTKNGLHLQYDLHRISGSNLCYFSPSSTKMCRINMPEQTQLQFGC